MVDIMLSREKWSDHCWSGRTDGKDLDFFLLFYYFLCLTEPESLYKIRFLNMVPVDIQA